MSTTMRSEGYSLWLVPSFSSALYTTIQSLINTIPSTYPDTNTPTFNPHITLTAGTIHLDHDQDPAEWLAHTTFSAAQQNLKVTINELHVGEIFFQKLIMLCEKTDELLGLAKECRKLATGEGEEDVESSDLPQSDVQAVLGQVKADIWEARRPNPDSTTAKGAEIWLVPTFTTIEDWTPVATKELPDVEWTWATWGRIDH
ncbi:uncharacterized protein LTR77_006564 [Saxophila tyrrhenica]|uniref:2',3'-cyclic-nucleotide 3'-phosphodiesterase n=1 Tax=Saxophila tyrrhenica TaxID=1690608 RepID=A0AAV9P768_9PEZI|nr:hypothetical protein LTR77_006564 [Saxophila tyrrhenica]